MRFTSVRPQDARHGGLAQATLEPISSAWIFMTEPVLPSPGNPSSGRRLRAVVFLCLLAVAGGLGWYYLLRVPDAPAPGGFPGGRGVASPWAAPVPVRVVPAIAEDLAVEVKAIGTVAPLNTVVVRSRVDGLLQRVLFQEGERVEAGEVLAEIDPESFRVSLAQAEGALQQNLAQLKNAESELAIYRRLFQQDSIARQQLDAQEALVNQLRGTLMTDRAQVDNAKLQLSYTKITAPIGGRLGLRKVDAGNLIASGDADGIVTITQTQPIAVLFTVPEVQLADIRTAHAAGRLLVVEAWDRNEQKMLAEGVLTTLDNQIDIATGTLRLKAQFDNEDDALFPNQFVNVRLRVRTLEGAITIPVDAVQHGSQGTYVYMISDGKATVRPIRLGPTSNSRITVTEGVLEGDEVVLEGLDRLREGRAVTIVNESNAGTPTSRPAQNPNRGG